jgi:DNA-directed RNA polymerase subunit RPC12/RpoP
MAIIPALMGWFGKKYKCEACGTKFKTEAELADHAKTHKTAAAENDSGSGLYPCETCMEEFESKGELQDHIKQFH